MSNTKKLGEFLSQYLGMEVEVVDMNNPDPDLSPEAKRIVEEERAKSQARRAQVAKLASGLLKTIDSNCCEKPEHRRVPATADDRLAIDNAMACLVTQYGECVMELIGRQRELIDALAKQLGKAVHPSNETEFAELDLEMAALHSIVQAHFDLIARPGKINHLNHYSKIDAVIKAWSENKETGSEARRTH